MLLAFVGWPLYAGVAAAVVFVLILMGLVVIGEDESGLVIRRWGSALPPGRLVAVRGEAGFQAALLMPGWHFGYWPWQFKVRHVPMIVVRPGEIGLVVASDGENIPAERILGREVKCDHFQDATAFLDHGGEKGRQIAFLRAGKYRVNPAMFQVILPITASNHGLSPRELMVFELPPDTVGIVTTSDGRSITAGDLAGATVPGHESFQDGQRFILAGGCRGLQEEVLLSGAWNMNPWLVRVEPIQMTEIPIGYVGVVVSYVGGEHVDISGADFTHGDLVEKGKKGVWIEPLMPGKHPINTRIMKVELVPTTNIVLNWARRTEAHGYDANLGPITVRSRDGFSFNLDVSQIIHIAAKNAPRVISRVGSMQNLVDHVLQPTVANYFRNSAQAVTVLDFLSERSARQDEAYEAITRAVLAYDVECIDTLIGDIDPPAELMKTQTDKKIADELTRTYDAQREAQKKRQELARETAIANMQEEVVRSEQLVRIAEKNALAVEEHAKGDAAAYRLKVDAEAAGQRVKGESEAAATRAIGAAKADAYRLGIEALGVPSYAAMQIAAILGEHKVKLVPDIAVSGGEGYSLAPVFMAKLLQGTADLPGPRPPA